MNKTYKDMLACHELVEYSYGRMGYLAKEIAKANYAGDVTKAEQLHDEWELWTERKAIALSNEIDCLELQNIA